MGDRRISAKSIADQLSISRERVGSTISEDLDMRKLSAKWVPKCLNADQNVSSASRLSKFGIFSARSKWFPLAIGDHERNLVISLWPGDKATINGVSAWRLTPPSKIQSAKIRWKSSRLVFLRSRRHPPQWLSSKGPNYQRGVLLISSGAIEGHFEGNTPQEGHQGGSCSCMTMPWLTWHLQPRRNWPIWAYRVFITLPILRIWPYRTTTCSLDWKNNWKVTIFHPTRRSFVIVVIDIIAFCIHKIK